MISRIKLAVLSFLSSLPFQAPQTHSAVTPPKLSHNPTFSVVLGLLHHHYIRYSNAKSDPLSAAVLLPGLAPPTLFSIHSVKTGLKKIRLCVSDTVSPCHSLSAPSRALCLCVSVCLRDPRAQ